MAGQGTGSACLNIHRNSNEQEREDGGVTDMKVEREIGRKCRESEKRCGNKSKIETERKANPPPYPEQQKPSLPSGRTDELQLNSTTMSLIDSSFT